MSKGQFIIIEGSDGSGKATQLELVVKKLRANGHTVAVFDFPQYGKKSAGPVEEYLNGAYGDVHAVTPYVASLFYAIDRFDASFKIRSALESGALVFSNRYVLSSAAHQGAKIKDESERAKFLKWLEELEYGMLNLPRPDLTVFLHVPAEIGYDLVLKKTQREHLQGKARDIHEADQDYLKTSESSYLDLAKYDSAIHTIECAPHGELLSIDEIHPLMMKEIQTIL